MERKDIVIVHARMPWKIGEGAISGDDCPGGWDEAINVHSDGWGWRLALEIEGKEFIIRDVEKLPREEIDSTDIKTPEQLDAFVNRLKKEFGEYTPLTNEEIIGRAKEIQQLSRDGKDKEAHNLAKEVFNALAAPKFIKEIDEKAKIYFSNVDFDNFMAKDYADVKNDYNVTKHQIINQVNYEKNKEWSEKLTGWISSGSNKDSKPEYVDIFSMVADRENELETISPTIDKYRTKGEKDAAVYTPDRTKLHIDILKKIIYDNVEKYIPEGNEQPTFILLGGRGGSGKSNFKSLVYDDSFVVLDSDIIKEMLPEYKGWNAAEVHEESSDILEQALRICQNNDLNVVVDATMNSAKSVEKRLDLFKQKGYHTEAHYMFLPPQKSAKRGLERFLQGGKNGRYVPVDVLLSMKNNEENFDKIKDHVDFWSFYSGDVDFGQKPYLVARKEDEMGYIEKKQSRYFFDLTPNVDYSKISLNSELQTFDLQLKERISQFKTKS